MFKFGLKNVKKDDLKMFIEMIPYVSSKIKSIEESENFVNIECDEDYNVEIIAEIEKLIEVISSTKNSNIGTKLIEDFTKIEVINKNDVFGELINTKAVRELAPGVFSYSGIFLKIYEYFDRKINEFAYDNFIGIVEEAYPVLFPIKEYIKGRYFENFPHYIMFQTKLDNNIDVYERFMSKKDSCSCIKEVIHDVTTPDNVLRHATCAPVYPSLENEIVKENESKCFLVSGRCFRNELLNIKELSRLNEFNMKEFVFVGNEEDIEEYISKSKILVKFWIDTFSLNSKCETANDSFFASNYKKLRYFQLIGNSKLEYKILIPNKDEYISCCSVNYHRTHFSKPYNIKNDFGEYCHTACFAFGIERLVYSFLSQKGLNLKKWDKKTYEEINKYVHL